MLPEECATGVIVAFPVLYYWRLYNQSEVKQADKNATTRYKQWMLQVGLVIRDTVEVRAFSRAPVLEDPRID